MDDFSRHNVKSVIDNIVDGRGKKMNLDEFLENAYGSFFEDVDAGAIDKNNFVGKILTKR